MLDRLLSRGFFQSIMQPSSTARVFRKASAGVLFALDRYRRGLLCFTVKMGAWGWSARQVQSY